MMKIKVIKYDGAEMDYDIVSFEFRTNQVSNWIRLKFGDGKVLNIHDICVIKTID